MRICHCTLPYMNPDACKSCPSYYDFNLPQRYDEGIKKDSVSAHKELKNWEELVMKWKQFKRETLNKQIWTIKGKKTTEKYDENGNLIERITEEM